MEPNPLFNLVEFDAGVLRPSASAFSRALSSRTKAYGFAELVASYFWLIFGLDAEYFPEQHTQAVFGQRFVQLISEFSNVYSRWGYVFDPEFGPLLTSAYNFRRPIQRDEKLRVHGDPIAKAAIRSALIAESKLKRSMAASTFLSLLSFDPDRLEQVLAAGQAMGSSDEGTIQQGTIALGFQDVVSYMRLLVDLSRALRREQAETVGTRCDYRLRQLTRWRVNRHSGIDGVFKKVAFFVNDSFSGGVYSQARVSFEIDELLDDWGFTHLKVATA